MNNINEMVNKLLLFWHSEGDDLFDNASKALLQQQAEIEALKDIMVVAIKSGDWTVDGACDPDQYIGDRL